MYPESIQKLILLFSKFPTVGQRTAGRFVFYLMKMPQEKIEELTRSISDLKKNILLCSFCFNPFELKQEQQALCPICQDPGRNKNQVCVVEKETDLITIEKTKKYKGLYFVLGGTLSPLKKQEIKNIRTEELAERIKNPEQFGLSGAKFQEIILAINPTTEGQATALYLERTLKPLNIKLSRLARGLPLGAELEYADQETLTSALEARR